MIAYSVINTLTGERVIGPLTDDDVGDARAVALTEKDRLQSEAARGLADDLAPHTVNGAIITYDLEIVDLVAREQEAEAAREAELAEIDQVQQDTIAQADADLQAKIDAAIDAKMTEAGIAVAK